MVWKYTVQHNEDPSYDTNTFDKSSNVTVFKPIYHLRNWLSEERYDLGAPETIAAMIENELELTAEQYDMLLTNIEAAALNDPSISSQRIRKTDLIS